MSIFNEKAFKAGATQSSIDAAVAANAAAQATAAVISLTDVELIYESLENTIAPLLGGINLTDIGEYLNRTFRVNRFNDTTAIDAQATWKTAGATVASGTYSAGLQADGTYVVDIATGEQLILTNVSSILSPLQFGVRIDTPNQEDTLQKAINASVGKIMDWSIPDGSEIQINGPLYLPSNVDWLGNGNIHNINTAANINSTAFMLGGFNPAYFDDYTYFALDAVSGGKTITLSTPSDSSNFSVGDLVWVVSNQTWVGSDGDYPQFAQLAEVEVIDGVSGDITLDTPISEDISALYGAAQICRAEEDAVLDLLGNPMRFCRNSKINGLVVKAPYASVGQRGGMYKCDFNFKECRSKNLIFANAFCRTSVRVQSGYFSRKALDIAGNSHDFNITVDNISYDYDAVLSEAISLFRVGENSRDGTVRIGSANLVGYNFSGDIGLIDSGSKRVLMIFDNVNAPDQTGDGFAINQAVSGGTQQVIEDCLLKVNSVRLSDSCSTGFHFRAVAGDQFLKRCGFEGRINSGTFSTLNAVEMGGQDSYCNVFSNSGRLRIPTGISGTLCRGFYEGGLSNSSTLENDIFISSRASIDASVGNQRDQIVIISATASGTSNLTATFPANSFEAGDRWRIDFIGEKIGTSGTTNLRLEDDTPNSIDLSAVNTLQGEFHGFFEVIIQDSSRYTLYGHLNFEGQSSVVDFIDSSENLSASTTFNFQSWKGDAGDTMRFHKLDSRIMKDYAR